MGEDLENCNDEKIMPYINMANLACGFHAGNKHTMTKSIINAKQNSVLIGAHPSYKDFENFGRISIKHTYDEIKDLVLYQLNSLDTIAKSCNEKVSYLKPHGALYNDMMKNDEIFTSILDAISSYNKDIKFMILSSNENEQNSILAKKYGIELLFEVFADRNYNDDGSLVSRKENNAVIYDVDEVKNRIILLRDKGYLLSINKEKLNLKAHSICVHGDNENAISLVKEIRGILDLS